MNGEQILNYRLLNKIGEGGMGSVYVAQHTQIERKAAIKALHPNLVNNPQIRERFKNEAATMARLMHPNIVGLYDYLESPQGLFLIIEFVEGLPLDHYLQKVSGPLSEERAVALFSKILEGFAYAHEQGVVHRDIKPSNLMISPDGKEVKILDFGIAKILGNESKSLTKTGSRMGTVLYMSPEQVKGQALDARSDIYSLGVTLFQMLTGRCPYNEDSMTEYEVYDQIVNHNLPRVQSFYPQVSTRMQAIIDKATAKNPAERFTSCLEFKRALEAGISSGGSTLAKTLPPNYTSTSTSSVSSKSLEGEQRPTRRKKKKDTWLVTLLLLVFMVIGGVAVVLFNPFDIPMFRSISIAHQFKTDEDFAEEMKEKVKKFYTAVESHQFENIKPFYRAEIENYFGNLNRTLSPDIQAAYKIYWEKYIAEKHEIDWESYEYFHDENDNHIVKFSMRYYFKMEGEEWKNLKVNTEIRFDNNLLIYYINRF